MGRDVESMVRDLVESSIRMVKQQRFETVKTVLQQMRKNALWIFLFPTSRRARTPIHSVRCLARRRSNLRPPRPMRKNRSVCPAGTRFARTCVLGKLDNLVIEIEVEVSQGMGMEIPGMGGESMGDLLSGILPPKKKAQK